MAACRPDKGGRRGQGSVGSQTDGCDSVLHRITVIVAPGDETRPYCGFALAVDGMTIDACQCW